MKIFCNIIYTYTNGVLLILCYTAPSGSGRDIASIGGTNLFQVQYLKLLLNAPPMILIINPSDSSGLTSHGMSIYHVLCASNSVNVMNLSLDEMNDRCFLADQIIKLRPSVLINCCEYHDLDAAEYYREQAYAINGFIVGSMAEICKEMNIIFIHISSSYIFNGAVSEPYNEESDPDPLSVYGDSKLLGERLIVASGCQFLIVRVSDVYGEHVPFMSMKFLTMNGGISINILKDSVIAPTSAADIGGALSELIKRDARGIIHINQTGSTTTQGFLNTAFTMAGENILHEKKIKINELSADEFLAPGERLQYNVMDSSRFTALTGIKMRTWTAALEDFAAQHKNLITQCLPGEPYETV